MCTLANSEDPDEISSGSTLFANGLQRKKYNFILQIITCMGESSQDYSWIQDFEADFPQKVSPKMLN